MATDTVNIRWPQGSEAERAKVDAAVQVWARKAGLNPDRATGAFFRAAALEKARRTEAQQELARLKRLEADAGEGEW